MRERYSAADPGPGLGPRPTSPRKRCTPTPATRASRSTTGMPWEDPFRLTVDAYYKYQAEKDKRLYAVLDGFAQGQGHLQPDRRALPQRDEDLPAGRDPAGVRGAPPLRVPRPPPRRGRARGSRRCARASTSCGTRQTEIHTLSRTTTSTTRASTAGQRCTTGSGTCRCPSRSSTTRITRRPVRVPDLDLVQLRVPADEPAVRAVHERRQLQRRPADDDVRLLRAKRREPAHDPRPGGASSSCSSRTRTTCRSSRTGSTSGSGADTGCSALVAAMMDYMLPQAVHELEGGVRALLRGADAGRAVPRPGVLRHPARRGTCEQAIAEKDIHQPPGVLDAVHTSATRRRSPPRSRRRRSMDWLSGSYPDTFDRHYRPLWDKAQAARRTRATGSSSTACRCCARPARSR